MGYLVKNKISKGLSSLVKKKNINHFSKANDNFITNEKSRDNYLKQFNQALVVELSEHL